MPEARFCDTAPLPAVGFCRTVSLAKSKVLLPRARFCRTVPLPEARFCRTALLARSKVLGDTLLARSKVLFYETASLAQTSFEARFYETASLAQTSFYELAPLAQTRGACFPNGVSNGILNGLPPCCLKCSHLESQMRS